MNLLLLSHELLVLALALGLILVDLWLPPAAKRKLGYAAALGVGLILLYSVCCVRVSPDGPLQYAFGQMYALDALALFFKRFFLLAALIVLLLSMEFADRIADGITEFYALVLFALSGMLFASSVNDFALLFVSLELITVTFYVLTSFQRARVTSLEAGVKYLIIGALSAGFTVFGIALVYGMSHTLNFGALVGMAAQFGGNKVFLFGLALVLAGLGFKIAAFSVPDLGAGCLPGRAHAGDRIPRPWLQSGGFRSAAPRALYCRAGHHGSMVSPADHPFRRLDSLRQPLRHSAAQPQTTARLFEHSARRLSAPGHRRS